MPPPGKMAAWSQTWWSYVCLLPMGSPGQALSLLKGQRDPGALTSPSIPDFQGQGLTVDGYEAPVLRLEASRGRWLPAGLAKAVFLRMGLP